MSIRNDTLIGVLKDRSITLRGRLSGPDVTLIGVTNIFKYIERLDLGELSAGLCLSGDISELTATTAHEIIAALKLAGHLQEISLEKCLNDMVANVALAGNLRNALNKSTVPEGAGVAIGASVDIESVRLRKLGDLAGLTLGDLSTWTMQDLYYKEE